MVYNGNENDLPDIDFEFPQIPDPAGGQKSTRSVVASKLASDPKNKSWINCSLGFDSESTSSFCLLDALAGATRSFVDESQEQEGQFDTCLSYLNPAQIVIDEESKNSRSVMHAGHQLLVNALRVMTSEETSEKQAQNAFHVLKAILRQPMLLYQGGPTSLFVYRSMQFTARLINKLHKEGHRDESSNALFNEALQLYNAVRVVFNMHNDKMPREIRCPEIPIPNPTSTKKSSPLIEFVNTFKSKEMDEDEKNPGTSAHGIEKECDINDKSFLVFLSGSFLG
jgi:hypothetical protein